MLRPRDRPAVDRLTARLRGTACRFAPYLQSAIPGNSLPHQSPRGERNRRERLDRGAADDRARSARCTGAIRHRASRHAADAAKDLGRDPGCTRWRQSSPPRKRGSRASPAGDCDLWVRAFAGMTKSISNGPNLQESFSGQIRTTNSCNGAFMPDPVITQRTMQVEHIKIESRKSFSEVKAALESLA